MVMVRVESALLAALSHRPNQPGRKHLTRTASITTCFKGRVKPTLPLAGVPQVFAGYRLVAACTIPQMRLPSATHLFNWLLPRASLLLPAAAKEKLSAATKKLLRTANSQ